MRRSTDMIQDIRHPQTMRYLNGSLVELFRRCDSLEVRTNDPSGEELYDGRKWVRGDLFELRVYKKNIKYRMTLVQANDSNASNIRCFVGGTIKALAKATAIQNIATSLYGSATKNWLYGLEDGTAENTVDGNTLTEYGVTSQLNDQFYMEYSVSFEFSSQHTIQKIRLFHRWSIIIYNEPTGYGLWVTIRVFRNGGWEDIQDVDLHVVDNISYGSGGDYGVSGEWFEIDNLDLVGVEKVQVYVNGRDLTAGGVSHHTGEIEIYAASNIGITVFTNGVNQSIKLDVV